LGFINCIYRHNTRFSKKYNTKLYLSKNKFSYHNVHLNLGNVRWYSTKIIVKTISSKLLVSKTDKIIKEDSLVFNKLSDFLSNSPINEDTQLKIEKFLYNLIIKILQIKYR
jgi:hypothetical protein